MESETYDQLEAIWHLYITEQELWEDTKDDKHAIRARKCLSQIMKLSKMRRSELQKERKDVLFDNYKKEN